MSKEKNKHQGSHKVLIYNDILLAKYARAMVTQNLWESPLSLECELRHEEETICFVQCPAHGMLKCLACEGMIEGVNRPLGPGIRIVLMLVNFSVFLGCNLHHLTVFFLGLP